MAWKGFGYIPLLVRTGALMGVLRELGVAAIFTADMPLDTVVDQVAQAILQAGRVRLAANASVLSTISPRLLRMKLVGVRRTSSKPRAMLRPTRLLGR